jgi:BON domain
MMRIRTLMLAGAAVAAIAYLFEPRGGRARRERLIASLGSLGRRRVGELERSTPLPENLAPQPVRPEPPPPTQRSSTPTPSFVPATTEAAAEAPEVPDRERSMEWSREPSRDVGEDAEIVERVTSTLEARRDLHAEDLVIDVVNGIAYLSGDLHDPHTFGEIVDVTRNVPGVRRVQSLLHLPDSETVTRTISAHRVGKDEPSKREAN